MRITIWIPRAHTRERQHALLTLSRQRQGIPKVNWQSHEFSKRLATINKVKKGKQIVSVNSRLPRRHTHICPCKCKHVYTHMHTHHNPPNFFFPKQEAASVNNIYKLEWLLKAPQNYLALKKKIGELK